MSYRDEPSASELQARRAPLESEAAACLGHLLIGHSRIVVALQSHGAESTQPSLAEWSARAQRAEALARSVRDGRWLPDPRRNVVLLLGLPADGGAHRAFTIADLQRAVREQRELLAEFNRLCAEARALAT